MTMLKRTTAFLENHADYGAVFIRLIIGFHLIYGTQDNVFSWARMLEFRDFLAANGVIAPLIAAHISVYAQFISGTLIIVGLFTRYAAFVMIVNFIAALLIAHIGDAYPSTFPALMMLAAALFLLFNGAGKPSLDYVLKERWVKTI